MYGGGGGGNVLQSSKGGRVNKAACVMYRMELPHSQKCLWSPRFMRRPDV